MGGNSPASRGKVSIRISPGGGAIPRLLCPEGKPFWGSTPSTIVTSVGAFLTMRATSVH